MNPPQYRNKTKEGMYGCLRFCRKNHTRNLMKRHQPDFNQLLTVIKRGKPNRPVLFELFMNLPLYEAVNGEKLRADDPLSVAKFTVSAFEKMGYDYATVYASSFRFTAVPLMKQTQSLNEGAVIFDEKSFEQFVWPNPEDFDSSFLHDIQRDLPDGMKLMVMSPGGVLEVVISLVGYDTLCMMVYDEPGLVGRIFDEVGKRLVSYYELALQHDSVGLISSNDDWGFNTQTFLSTEMMRQYVFPWHQKIVDTVHSFDRPVFLHSCGNLARVMDDVILMGYNAKHSFEDNILPIEEAYVQYHDRIALLGGIDMDYLCRQDEQSIYDRTQALLRLTQGGTGWAVGTGNSVPEYLPQKALFAMHRAAREFVL